MKLMIGLAMLFAPAAFAYIPEFSLIASRAADQHGKSAYQIEQEVTYRREAEVYSVKETWLVLNENNLRVSLEGRGPLKGLVQGTYIYDGSVKTFIDLGQTVRSSRLGEEWLEPLLHFRNSKYFRSRLVNLKVAPVDTLRDRAPMNSEGPPNYEPPGFIRLSRSGGSVCWAIGVAPTVGTAPTLWLEQDQFVVRKFRNASQMVWKADNYARYGDTKPGGEFFWYPKTQTYTYGSYTIQINTISVKQLGKISTADSRFKTSALSAAADMIKLPEADGLREFYSRFR